MDKFLSAMIIVMCCMIVISSFFNIRLSNDFFTDYNAEFSLIQDTADAARSVGDWIAKAYNAVFGSQSIISAFKNLPGEVDAKWLYVGQPAKFFAEHMSIVSPMYSSEADIDAMFDAAYSLLLNYMSKSDASAAMDEFGERCFFFFDQNGASYASYVNTPMPMDDGSTDWLYLDNLDESSGIAGFLNDASEWLERKLSVGLTSDLYTVRTGLYWQELDALNLDQLILAQVAESGKKYGRVPIVALPFNRSVWKACMTSSPIAWHLAGGAQIYLR